MRRWTLRTPQRFPAIGSARCSRSRVSSSTTRGATTSSSPTCSALAPDGRPWAELWLGTHPNGPATLADGRPLADVTGPLPYLLKVLAAAEPLSLQAHPSRRAGAGRVRRRALPRPRAEARAALRPDRRSRRSAASARSTPRSTCSASSAPTSWPPPLRRARPGRGAGRAVPRPPARRPDRRRGRGERPARGRVGAAPGRRAIPATPAWRSTLLLNLVHLQPGQAIQLGPGNLHAYLGGAGIELMGASDNVVRGGLTTKPVDVDDLLAVLDPTPLADPVMAAGADARRSTARRSAC